MSIAGIIDIETCDNENRYVKKLATKVVRNVDKCDGMRHRELLPASRILSKRQGSRCMAVGDEAHRKACGTWLLASGFGGSEEGRACERSARFFLGL